MSYCEPTADDSRACRHCGWVYLGRSAAMPRRNCPALRGSDAPPARSPIGDSGRRELRDEAEVARLRTLCTACDRWDSSAPGCRQDCAGRRATRHAARLLRGDCPLGRWA